MNDTGSISKLVGLNLKKLRCEAGFTAFQFAKLVGIKSEQQLYRYERGVNKIGIDELVAALKALDINIGEFFERLEKENSVADDLLDIDKEKHYLETQMIIEPSSRTLLVGSD
ncbi:helix-turn-helix domain-containing protein [Providencia sp.]|uniref:helix-turn-helix domain-containing protein n=1 Tax=Providencia sp. TaxID=589 RepID=UPI000E80A42F|nr:helix-turn-helix transcriptional regulator [Providencia sp.]HBO25041.1 XRE family transcriptional regulator [Providencia sp.]